MTTDVWQQLCTTSTCLARLQRDHRAVTATMADQTTSGTTAHGVNADPAGTVEWTVVEAAALRRIATQATRYQFLIQQALVALLEADIIRGTTMTATPVDTVKAAASIRCDGGAGEWADPTCERNAVTLPHGIWIDGHNHMLCDRCWARQRQRKHREVVA